MAMTLAWRKNFLHGRFVAVMASRLCHQGRLAGASRQSSARNAWRCRPSALGCALSLWSRAMNPSPSLLLAGCGDIGSRLARLMLSADWTVYGLRRDISRLPLGVLPVAGDLHQAACPAAWPCAALDYLVYCVAASECGEAGYRAAYVDGLRHVLGWLARAGQRPKRALFVSSTSGYCQCEGGWV